VAGELDYSPRPKVAAQAAERFFPNARTAVVPGGGHFPWLDNPKALVAAITSV
jgi:pimeloyl-ACP methyl ester carboxylesterase